MPRTGSVAEWDGKPGRMPPRMWAAQRAPRLKGYATVLRRRINECGWVSGEKTFGGVGNSYKEACVLGAAGYGSKGGCGIFNTNQNFLNRFLLGNGDFDVNVWNRGVYTSK